MSWFEPQTERVGQPVIDERLQITRTQRLSGKLIQHPRGHHRYEVESTASGHVAAGCIEHPAGVEVGRLPLVCGPDLPLHLVNFSQAASLKRELNPLPDLTDGLDGHGIRLTLQDVEQLSNSPPAFVTVAKLRTPDME
jgi:hypothetical protein